MKELYHVLLEHVARSLGVNSLVLELSAKLLALLFPDPAVPFRRPKIPQRCSVVSINLLQYLRGLHTGYQGIVDFQGLHPRLAQLLGHLVDYLSSPIHQLLVRCICQPRRPYIQPVSDVNVIGVNALPFPTSSFPPDVKRSHGRVSKIHRSTSQHSYTMNHSTLTSSSSDLRRHIQKAFLLPIHIPIRHISPVLSPLTR